MIELYELANEKTITGVGPLGCHMRLAQILYKDHGIHVQDRTQATLKAKRLLDEYAEKCMAKAFTRFGVDEDETYPPEHHRQDTSGMLCTGVAGDPRNAPLDEGTHSEFSAVRFGNRDMGGAEKQTVAESRGMMDEEIVQVEFWIDDHIHAMRHTSLVPVIGDEVRFNNVAYKVHYRIWIYDDKYPRVALNMEEVPRENKTEQEQK